MEQPRPFPWRTLDVAPGLHEDPGPAAHPRPGSRPLSLLLPSGRYERGEEGSRAFLLTSGNWSSSPRQGYYLCA